MVKWEKKNNQQKKKTNQKKQKKQKHMKTQTHISRHIIAIVLIFYLKNTVNIAKY